MATQYECDWDEMCEASFASRDDLDEHEREHWREAETGRRRRKDTHTPPSSLRIPADVKEAAQRRAAKEGRTLTDVVVTYLRQYGAEQKATGTIPAAN